MLHCQNQFFGQVTTQIIIGQYLQTIPILKEKSMVITVITSQFT